MNPMETLAHGLRKAGCAIATPMAGHVRVLVEGMPARITPFHGGLSFRTTICADDMTLDAGRINAANLAVRFARYSADGGRLVVACDMLERDDHRLIGHLTLWGHVVRDARRLIAELMQTPIATQGE